MMKKIAALVGVLLLLGGCEQSKIKASIAEDMKDPSSVKFGEFEWVDNFDTRTDCGDDWCPIACLGANAKNSFGAYAGEDIYLVEKNAEGRYWSRKLWGHSVASCAKKYATELY